MKNFLLFNQSFGTVGSPNQTDETQTRENRIGLMSYLRRPLMLLFAVLVMSMANVGVAWGASPYNLDITSYAWGGTGNKSANDGTITVAGYIQGKTYNNVGSTKVAYISGTNYLTVSATSACITSISITANTDNNSNTHQLQYCTSANGSTWGDATDVSGTFANKTSTPQTRTVNFSPAVQYVRFNNKDNAISAGAISVTYSSGVTHTVTAATEDEDKGTAAAGSATVVEGATTTITATPKSGYKFDHWTVSGTGATLSSTSTNPTTLTMGTSDVTVTAYFVVDPCSAWGYGTANTTAPSSGNSVTVGDLTVANVGCSTSSTTPFSGGTSTGVILGNGASKYITGTLGGDEIESIRFSIYTSDAAKPTYVVAFSSSATYDAATVLKVSGDYTAYFYDDAPAASGTRKDVEVTAPAGAKSFAIGRNLSGVSHGGTEQNSGSRGVYYIAACPADAPACTAPTSPNITGTTTYTAGGTISLTAEATGTSGTTTYQWYKGDPDDGGVSQGAASTSGATFSKASCVVGDAGTYYCVISNGTGCTTKVSQTITVEEEHWYVYGNFSDGSTWTDTEVTMDGNVNINIPMDAHDYSFKIKHTRGESTWYSGNNGIMSRGECTNWDMNVNENCRIRTDISGTYNFALTLNESTPRVTVTYPTGGVPVTLVLNNGGSNYSWYTRSGDPIIRPNFEPSKDGYAFDGWYADEECTEPWNWSTTVSSATTLYAKWSNAWFYHGEWDDDWAAKTMTRSDHGSFWYWKTSKADGNRLFKIQQNGSWYGYQYISKEYMCTTWTNMNDNSNNWGVSDNRCAVYNNTDDNYYIIVFPPYTVANPTANPIICASSSLPEDYYVVPNGRTIYFDNSEAAWSGIYFRRGRTCHNAADALTKVSGTDNLYKYTVGTAYNGYQAFHLANNTSWTGNNNIYLVNGSGYEITKSLEFQKYNLDEDVTFTPGDEGDKKDGCQYYVATKTSGMKTDRVTISPYDHGTITVNYTNTSNVASTLTSGYADLAHTVILSSITATPNTGYDAGAITINGGAYSANHVVTGPTTIAATFTATNYTIAYDLAGGSVASPNPTSYTIESSAITLNNPTKTGYTFAGWTGTDLAEATTTVTIAAGSTGNRSYTATWTEIVPTSVSLNKTSTSISVGGTETLTATVSPDNALDKSITWSSDATGVATVNSSGVVTGVAAGTATITATTSNSKTATCTVTVTAAVTCSGDPTALVNGELYTIDEMVSNCSATAISSTTSGGTGIFQYGLSSNGKFYVVGTTNGDNSTTGTVEMKKQGASTITVKDETFTYIAWFKGSGSTSCRSIKFVTPSAGTLIIYGKVSSGDGKGNIELKQGSNSAVDVMPKYKNASDTVHVNITAGATCYIWADGSSAALYGLKFVETSCSTPTTAFANGAYTIGGAALDLSTLISSNNSSGAITYSVTNANGTGATIAGDGYSFSATTAGTASISATQAANGDHCEKTMNATVTVSAAPAGTTYYLVTSTAQLNTTDTYVIMADDKSAMMGVASGSNPCLNAITSGFTVAADKSTVTVTSSDVNTLTLKSESDAWNLFGKDSHYITTNSTVNGNLYGNATSGSGTDDFVFSFADGKATIKRSTEANYHIYYTSGTGFNQSTSSTNIRLYTSNSTPVYTVTYDLNGGTGTVPTNRPEKSGTSITLASSTGLTKDGFTFDGWLCSVNSTKYAAGASYTMTAANTTFTAQWVEAAAPTLYTVTFNSNGGSAVSPITQASEGASITMPAPTYASHTFQGWVIGGTTYAAEASYTPTANITAYATWKENCAGGGGSGATLFTQNFNSATAVNYDAPTGSTAKEVLYNTSNPLSGLVGTGANLFTSIATSTKVGDIAINSTTGGNNVDATGFFQAYCAGNNTAYWSITRTADFAATAPTAIQVNMDIWYKNLSSGSDRGVQFAVGDGFSDGLKSTSAQSNSNVHSGFGIKSNSSPTLLQYGTSTNIYSTAITQSTWLSFVWVINNSGSSLTYNNPTGSGTSTLNNDCYAIWMKTQASADNTYTKIVDNQAATTASKDLQNLYIGYNASGKTHEFRLDNVVVKDLSPAGGGCYYVTYDGNGAETGSISDATAYTSGDAVTVSNNTGGSAFTKTGYRFNGWNTADNGSGMAYAAGATFNISENVTLYAQWVLDACSAPAAPTISGTASRTVGQNIELTATCASGADGSTTYTWYKGETFDGAEQVQAAMTAGEGGRTFTKASCEAGDAGKYWCKASNGSGCEVHNETGFTVTVSAAVEEHIYYYKDANHYSDGTYSDPEGNTAASGDNKSLSSPWMICNGCKAGVDSVVAHGATYDGKGNWVDAYIKLPSGGDASTKNIKFALAAGYTGTLKIKMGKYKDSSTLPTASLKLNGAGEAISPTSGGPGGVATTEDNFGEITWNLSTAGGTYILTVSSANAYISQIDMTTETSAKFNVTYNGNGSTGGDVPTDDTDYDADASVTVQAQGTMVKDNYTFGGWNTANNGTGTNYVAGSGTFSIKGATTLYAHWTQSIYLAQGAQGSGTNGATVSWNGTAVRGFTAHTAAGYSLTGYYTAPSGGTKVLNADGSFAATNIDGYITDGKWSRTGAEATLYAQWSGSAIVTNTLNVGGSKTWGSSISTTATLQITNLSALAGQGGIKVGEATDDQAAAGTPGSGKGKSSLSPKVEANNGESKNAGEYMELGFTVAPGYLLRVTGLSVIVRSVSNDGKYDAILSDGTNSIEVTGVNVAESLGSGANLFSSSYNTTFEGNVTLKIWGYSKSSDKAMATYRYATPIAIYGAVEETCTPPTFSGLDYSATEYTQGDPASAISVTGAANETTYAWKQNTTNDRSGDTEAAGTGANTASFTPSTASTGTLYYWCELTNGCTTVKTSTVAVTVSASASNPTVTWSDVKLNGAATTVNYGGGKYELRATVDQTGWSGTLESSMVTAPAGITIHDVTTGTADNKRYIEFQFDVTTAFDREENETIGFHLSLPAISGWNALTSDKQVAYEACDEGAGVAGMIYLPVKSTQTTAKSGMQYYWESTGSGRLASQYGSPMGAANNPSGYKTADSTFYYYAASTGDKWMFQTYVGGVNKVRVVFRAAGALKSSHLTISKFCYDTEYFSSQGDRQVSIGEVSPSKASFASGEDGYMEFTVPEMAANSYAYFQTGSSNIKIYGIVLYSENSGSGGTIATNPAWSDELENGSTIYKAQGNANFTYTISTTTNTLGGITYSSSNSSVAEVNATTGEVRITATGESTQTAEITATLARSGCYQPATRTYTVSVTGNACTDPIGTIEAEDLGCDGTRMTFSGYAAGATIQWYKDGNTIADDGGDANVYTATEAGSYYAVAHLNCDRQSNSILVTAAEVDADRVVEKWYIKNGRLTPDIKLWTLDEGSHLVSVAWNTTNETGLNQADDIYESDGAVYLTGRAPGSNDSGDDISYTLTLTINNGCSGSTPTVLSDASKQITIVHQKNTDKHVLAFVVTGKQNGGFTESIPASQTTSVGLYNEIAKNFDVQATNIYSTDDEQKIKEYYSQFDIICITDYPNTKTKGSHSVSYSDAIGVMVDIRPVLTMEAWVSGLSNWNKKGISGDPKSPSTRQYTMLLQCKDHEIFAGTKLTEVGEGDDKMYRIHMVDETQHPYDTLDANYGSGTHESKKGYRYGSYPALQGFTFSQAMEDADLLPLGLIDDGAGKDLQVGLERQHEMSARMMVLGINSTAMERLTADGERIVINALKYLMKKNAEEIADCSTSFVGGAEGDEANWMNADNWSTGALPDKTTREVRILAPVVISSDHSIHCLAPIKIASDGTYNHGANEAEGKITIEAGGALKVEGKIEAVFAPKYNNPKATTPTDLILETNSTAQSALIFDNAEGETQAKVTVYSKAYKDGDNRYWQYLTSPLQETPVDPFFYGSGIYTYKHVEAQKGWVRYKPGTTFEAFDAIGITQSEASNYEFTGPLASTEDRDLELTYTSEATNRGLNMFGNSWTAPIQLTAIEDGDFGDGVQKTVYVYNTGKDADGGPSSADGSETPGQWQSIPLSSLSVLEGDGAWTGLTVIPAYQSFQLKCSINAVVHLSYEKHVRPATHDVTAALRAPKRAAGASDILAMRITVSEEKTHSDVYLLESDKFTDGFDNGWDGDYVNNDTRTARLYIVSEELGNMAVSAQPTLEGTALGFRQSNNGETYEFSFHCASGEYYLNDMKERKSTLILTGNTYEFVWANGDDANRFYISKTAIDAPQVPTGATDLDSEAPKARKVIYNDKMYIFNNGRVYDAQGKVVK